MKNKFICFIFVLLSAAICFALIIRYSGEEERSTAVKSENTGRTGQKSAEKKSAEEMSAEEMSADPAESESSDSDPAKVDPPVFSRESGFYDKAFSLRISAPEGTKIYYTLDCSEPGRDSSRYKEPVKIQDVSAQPGIHCRRTDFEPYLPAMKSDYVTEVAPGWFTRSILPENVDKCQVVRAVAVDKDGNQSDVVTASYFIGYQDKPGYGNMGVLSLVSDPDDLFSSDTGIMVNGSTYDSYWKSGALDGIMDSHITRKYCNTYTGRGREWERNVHMDYFSNGGRSLIFSQEAGIRLHGNQSRVAEPQKSFNLYARKSYDGHKTFLAPFFDNGLLQDRVTLMRGNDIRNYYMSTRVNHRTMDTQDYRLVQVFLDGEYWGIYAIQERYNSEEYMRTHYNLGVDDYILAKGTPTGFDIKNGDPEAIRTSFREVRDFAKYNDLSEEDNYQEICKVMDMQSFIDGYAVRLYTGDQDWSWFKNQYLLFYDHKWHWLIFDIDYGAGKHHGPEENTFTSTRLIANYSLANDPLFPYLMKNEGFRRQFVNTYLDLGNECFKGKLLRKELGKLAKDCRDEGILESKRYPSDEYMHRMDDPAYISEFNQLCEEIASYFEERLAYASGQLADYFGLKGQPVTISIQNSEPENGTVKINTVKPTLDKNNTWSGIYYTDFPVTITAEPEEGWEFAGWDIEGGELKTLDPQSAELSFKEDVEVKAYWTKK